MRDAADRAGGRGAVAPALPFAWAAPAWAGRFGGRFVAVAVAVGFFVAVIADFVAGASAVAGAMR